MDSFRVKAVFEFLAMPSKMTLLYTTGTLSFFVFTVSYVRRFIKDRYKFLLDKFNNKTSGASMVPRVAGDDANN